MPFAALLPLAGSLLKSASDNTNRKNQFKAGLIENTFTPFTGRSQNVNPLIANNSANTLLQGAAGSLQAGAELQQQDLLKNLLNKGSASISAQSLQPAAGGALSQAANGGSFGAFQNRVNNLGSGFNL